MKKAPFVPITIVVCAGLALAGQPRISQHPLSIERNGVHAPYTLRNKKGELMAYNFRAVESNALYRGSGFVQNREVVVGGQLKKRPAAFADSLLYDLFRSKNIRTVVSLQEPQYFYAEKGYFDYWNEAPANRGRYNIGVVQLSVKNGHSYDKDGNALRAYSDRNDNRFGLRAAAEFIQWMKKRKPSDGAVYIHCDAGKDRTGVVVAAYELWRNQGQLDADRLWAQVLNRYLVSNIVIGRDPEASRFAGGLNACGAGEPPGYVCGSWLNSIRPQLQTIAQLD